MSGFDKEFNRYRYIRRNYTRIASFNIGSISYKIYRSANGKRYVAYRNFVRIQLREILTLYDNHYDLYTNDTFEYISDDEKEKIERQAIAECL